MDAGPTARSSSRASSVDHVGLAAAPGAGRVGVDPREHVQRLVGHRAQGEQVEVGARVEEALTGGGPSYEPIRGGR